MTVYSLVVFVHVLAGVFLVGGSVVSLFVRSAIVGAESTSALGMWLRFAERSTRFNPAVAMVLLATGIYLGSAGWWTSPWFFASIALWLVSGAYAARTIGAGAQALGKAVGPMPDGPVTAELDALRRRPSWQIAFDVLVAADLAAVFLMTNKPGILGSIGAIVVANAVTIGASAAVRRRRESAVTAAPARVLRTQ